jgi:hypothetical protein
MASTPPPPDAAEKGGVVAALAEWIGIIAVLAITAWQVNKTGTAMRKRLAELGREGAALLGRAETDELVVRPVDASAADAKPGEPVSRPDG